MTTHRSIEQIVEEQAHRWQLFRSVNREEKPRTVVTVSREHGSRGGEVARLLAQELGFDFFDREILQRIAEDAHLGERVVAALDDRDRRILSDWMTSFASDRHLSPAGYLYHLTRVVGAIAQHGGAVILGRGAHLILGEGRALRVLVVAPLPARVAAVMERDGVPEREARHRITEVDSERKAFLIKNFHTEFGDPCRFDLTLNTATLGVGGAVTAIRAALAAVPAGTPAVAAAR
jgi:cytidylate kinase